MSYKFDITGKEKWYHSSNDSYYKYCLGINAPELLLELKDRKEIPFGCIQWLKDGNEITWLVVKKILDDGIEAGKDFLKKINCNVLLAEQRDKIEEAVLRLESMACYKLSFWGEFSIEIKKKLWEKLPGLIKELNELRNKLEKTQNLKKDERVDLEERINEVSKNIKNIEYYAKL